MKKLYFTLFLFLSISKISFPQNPIVGAIRWDGWVGGLNTDGVGAPTVGLQVERSLGPNKYHFRVPFFGVEIGTDTVQARELTQTIMNQDIAYAKYAGINYWAFVYYPDNSGLDTARKLYDGSTHKNDVKYCYILGASAQPSFTWLVSKFSEANYQKVLNNRPLLYIFGGAGGYTVAQINSIRNLATSAGLGTPYIVLMNLNSTSVSNALESIGADAISAYVTFSGGGGPYSSLVFSEVNNWESHKATGKKVVPWVTSGWDPRPRYDNPVSWATVGPNDWIQTATAVEVANHLSDGLNWARTYPSSAEANTVLMYAWNEFDEGGWICPTLLGGAERLDAIRNIIFSTATSNLAINKAYASSSNWDNKQTAVKAFDGIPATNWQAADGSTFNGQWLQVNFGAATTFDSVRLSEYGNRTTGFRIEYSNDSSSWSTAFTGTTIGNSKTIKFNSKTAKYARVYFTSGTTTPIIYEFEIYNTNSNLALNSAYTSSTNRGATQTADKAFDASLATNWQAQNGTFANQWLSVNFEETVMFDKVVLNELGNRTTGFRIEYSDDGSIWQTAFTGTCIGNSKTITFPPVTGSNARIYFTSGRIAPIISEFELFNSATISSLKRSPIAVVDKVTTGTRPNIVQLYPNPARYNLRFVYDSDKEDDIVISIINSAGQQLQSKRIKVIKGQTFQMIDVSKLPSGVYFMKVQGERTVVKQFVINNQ